MFLIYGNQTTSDFFFIIFFCFSISFTYTQATGCNDKLGEGKGVILKLTLRAEEIKCENHVNSLF